MLLCLIYFNTRGRIRTDPGSILSALSLPLDYTGIYETIITQRVIIVKCSLLGSNQSIRSYEDRAFARELNERL